MCLAESSTIGGEHQQSVNIFLGIILWILVATQSWFKQQLSGSATAQVSAGPPSCTAFEATNTSNILLCDGMNAPMSRRTHIVHHELWGDTFSGGIRIPHGSPGRGSIHTSMVEPVPWQCMSTDM